MNNVSRLRRLPSEQQAEINFYWQGQPVSALSGDTLASALLAAGIPATRCSPVSGSRRAPFCMMGNCFECLVELDGVQVQACMTPVQEGMRVFMPMLKEQS